MAVIQLKRSKSLLMVDDDPVAHFLLKGQLKFLDRAIQFKGVNNGREAIDHLLSIKKNNGAEFFPDLILLDLKMPVLDGWGFLEQYESLFADEAVRTEIYVISADLTNEAISRSGAFKTPLRFLEKPFSDFDLVEMINPGVSRTSDM